ncbi:12580_t:CDS:2 [Funneliformis geosporum]|uniref:1978_t:CDS:1 n=1 Tax=Funneliformis geosporum TaxID=1117311 RepID=A0A9W4SGN3_9GLOM|nr:12580_t:CDS:2 [Funneliformis geosporum]CAI2168884.1 1978_t:CDS:2 [Funneliformis geosporum]
MNTSKTPSKVQITFYHDENNVSASRRSNKRTLGDEKEITPLNMLSNARIRSPSQARTSNILRNTPGKPFGNKENLTPYFSQQFESNKKSSTTKDSQINLRSSINGSQIAYNENEMISPMKRIKYESGHIINVDAYKYRIEKLEAELRRQIDENQKLREESQKSCQEAEKIFERTKYMALGYKNDLYGPVYFDGDYTSINKLLRRLIKVIGQEVVNRFKEETLVDGELPALNQTYGWLEESGFLNYEVLKEFRAVEAVTSLDLTYTFENMRRDIINKTFVIDDSLELHIIQNTNRLLSVFGLPNSFQYLKSLKLSFMPIEDSYFNNLRGLKNLDELVIESAGIGNEALSHLVSLKSNLTFLNITGNKKINDDSMFLLVLFEKLVVLLLNETSVSMDGIRKFVSETHSIELSQLSIPSLCRKYLNRRNEIYCVEHKEGMKVDPSKVQFMSLLEIRKQLMFHYTVNNRINIVGRKEELEKTLIEILTRRNYDAKVMLLAGGR